MGDDAAKSLSLLVIILDAAADSSRRFAVIIHIKNLRVDPRAGGQSSQSRCFMYPSSGSKARRLSLGFFWINGPDRRIMSGWESESEKTNAAEREDRGESKSSLRIEPCSKINFEQGGSLSSFLLFLKWPSLPPSKSQSRDV
jgi:hypothetical protein